MRSRPVRVVRAPGRVNLIGDHTDYQAGFCLPVAVDREVVVRTVPRTDRVVTVRSDALPGMVKIPANGEDDPRRVEPAWGRVVAGVLRLLAPGPDVTGFDAEVTSTIPVGSGLSSSAAFAVAMAITAGEQWGIAAAPRSVAKIAQAAEHTATGVPCGIMDQMASVCGRAGHALLLDCRSLAIEPVPIPDAVAIVVVHTGIARRLEDSEYAARRGACEAAAARVGAENLRDVTLAQVGDDPIARHVVTENRRTSEFAAALGAEDLERCGRLMVESHASLRDDFHVSTAELDALVDALLASGAYGARLTGAGFGGCAVGLVPAAAAPAVVSDAVTRYVAATGLTPIPLPVHAVDGAGPIP